MTCSFASLNFGGGSNLNNSVKDQLFHSVYLLSLFVKD